MFRSVARIKQRLSEEECLSVLTQALRGVLALNGEDGYPYALPIDYLYDPAKRKVYFHSGKTGYKLDCIAASNKACFTVTDDGVRDDEGWWLILKSVVLFGEIEVIEDRAEVVEISRRLSHKFTQDEAYIDREIEKYAPATAILALSVRYMTGKFVREK